MNKILIDDLWYVDNENPIKILTAQLEEKTETIKELKNELQYNEKTIQKIQEHVTDIITTIKYLTEFNHELYNLLKKNNCEYFLNEAENKLICKRITKLL